MAVDVQGSGYVRVSKTIRDGPDVYLVPDQERRSSMPETMQRDQWQLFAFVCLLGIIIIDDPVESLIGSIQAHQSTVPLNKYVIVTDPLRADRKPVRGLLPLPESGNIHNGRWHCYSSATLGCFGSFDNGLTFYSADALADIDGIIIKVQIRPGKGDQLATAAPSKSGQIKEQFQLQLNIPIGLIWLDLADLSGRVPAGPVTVVV